MDEKNEQEVVIPQTKINNYLRVLIFSLTQIITHIAEAAEWLNRGEVVAIPTETVYGLAANALNETAVVKIFEAKNRPFFDPLIVHVASINDALKYVEEIPEPLLLLLNKFSPGALTVLLKKKKVIPDIVTSGLDTVGIRIPSHPKAQALLSQLSFPLCAPSANPFGYVSPTTAQHVYDQLNGKIPCILDGGNSSVGVESTIVGLHEGFVTVFRLGGISIEEIEAEIGVVKILLNQSSNPKAPGMLDSHYAPRKPLFVGDISDLFSRYSGSKKGLISFSEFYPHLSFSERKILSPTSDLGEAAANLFAALRYFDNANVDVILVETFPEVGLGRAINDRLRRAATRL